MPHSELLTPNAYQEGAIQTEAPIRIFVQRKGPDGEWAPQEEINARLLHAAIGLATEAGEMLDMLKKHIFYGKELDKRNAFEEGGDSAWYLALAADSIGIPFELMLRANLQKLRIRYPEKFKAFAALNRDISKELEALEVTPHQKE